MMDLTSSGRLEESGIGRRLSATILATPLSTINSSSSSSSRSDEEQRQTEEKYQQQANEPRRRRRKWKMRPRRDDSQVMATSSSTTTTARARIGSCCNNKIIFTCHNKNLNYTHLSSPPSIGTIMLITLLLFNYLQLLCTQQIATATHNSNNIPTIKPNWFGVEAHELSEQQPATSSVQHHWHRHQNRDQSEVQKPALSAAHAFDLETAASSQRPNGVQRTLANQQTAGK